jgi:hypothetical protein
MRLTIILLLAGCDGSVSGTPPDDAGALAAVDGGRERDAGSTMPGTDGGDRDAGPIGPDPDPDAGVPFVPSDWCAAGDTALSALASTLEPGEFARMPDNASLAGLEMERALLYWSDSAVWDPAGRQVRWIGGPGTCCTDGRPATYQLIVYDVASDTWSIEATPFEGSGHSYDASAFDPVTRTHYFALFEDRAVKRLRGGEWDSPLPDLPWRAQPAVALAWLPDLGASGSLLYVNGNGETAWFDGSRWNEVIAPEPWGEYAVFAEYSPVSDLVWVGGGEGRPRVHYALDSGGGLRRLSDAPFSLSNASAHHAADPVTGRFVVATWESSPTWWEFDAVADRWTALESLRGVPSFMGSVFQVPIPECGVILYFDHYYDERNVYLYRHAP